MAESRPSGANHLRWGFFPTVAGAFASGALTAFASSRVWLGMDVGQGLISATAAAELANGSSVAASLSWVVLAAWGAVLVTRGWGRRVSAIIGLLASAGVLGSAIVWLGSAPDEARDALSLVGAADADLTLLVWWWLAVAGAFGTVLLGLISLRSMASWPEMGKRYDAPRRPSTVPVETDLTSAPEVWRAIDEGRDPTTRPDA